MVEQLNKEIEVILKKHVGGKPFFDALDMMIRSNSDILRIAMNHLITNTGVDDNVLVMTGAFGYIVQREYATLLNKRFCHVVTLPGGVSKAKPEILAFEMRSLKELATTWPDLVYYFFDDSFYSGVTKSTIERMLVETTKRTFHKSIVVYDGSYLYDESIISLFRYHDKNNLPF